MTGNGLRWMPLCISATTSALLAASAGSQASASQTHKLQHGETVSAVARKFHVSVRAIAEANPGINVNSVPDGHKLVIPSASHKKEASHKVASHKKEATSQIHLASGHHKVGYTRGDHVSLRKGPGERFPRSAAAWKGQKLVVSGIKDGWAHVVTSSGHSGWMRHDFVKYLHGGAPVTKMAAHHKKNSEEIAEAKHNARAKHAAAVAAAEKQAHQKHVEALAAAKHRAQAKHAAAVAAQQHGHGGHLADAVKHAVKIAHNSKSHHGAYAYSRDHGRGGDGVVGTAIAYRGTPYRYGSSGGGSFDCSGFTRFVYGRKGVSLPHSAKEQFHQGHSVSRGDMKPGDLVFFHTVTSGISHVGIYAGNGKFVHASSRRSGGVRVDSLDSGYYKGAFRGARRVKE